MRIDSDGVEAFVTLGLCVENVLCLLVPSCNHILNRPNRDSTVIC